MKPAPSTRTGKSNRGSGVAVDFWSGACRMFQVLTSSCHPKQAIFARLELECLTERVLLSINPGLHWLTPIVAARESALQKNTSPVPSTGTADPLANCISVVAPPLTNLGNSDPDGSTPAFIQPTIVVLAPHFASVPMSSMAKLAYNATSGTQWTNQPPGIYSIATSTSATNEQPSAPTGTLSDSASGDTNASLLKPVSIPIHGSNSGSFLKPVDPKSDILRTDSDSIPEPETANSLPLSSVLTSVVLSITDPVVAPPQPIVPISSVASASTPQFAPAGTASTPPASSSPVVVLTPISLVALASPAVAPSASPSPTPVVQPSLVGPTNQGSITSNLVSTNFAEPKATALAVASVTPAVAQSVVGQATQRAEILSIPIGSTARTFLVSALDDASRSVRAEAILIGLTTSVPEALSAVDPAVAAQRDNGVGRVFAFHTTALCRRTGLGFLKAADAARGRGSIRRRSARGFVAFQIVQPRPARRSGGLGTAAEGRSRASAGISCRSDRPCAQGPRAKECA